MAREIETQPQTSSAPTGASTSTSPSIFRVPNATREDNPQIYSPKTIGIGPYHCMFQYAEQKQEEEKRKYSDDFISRTQMGFRDVCHEITKIADDIRKCYGGEVEPDKGRFVQMLVYDGSFLLEFFVKMFEGDDSTQKLDADYKYDLYILENQLPMVLLDKLFSLAKNTGASFSQIIFHYFMRYNRGNIDDTGMRSEHLTDLLRYFLLPPSLRLESEQGTSRHIFKDKVPNKICSVSQLRNVGVQFKVDESSSLLDVQFHDGTLTMPLFVMDELTERHIRNVLAFEKYYYPSSTFVSAYFYMLSFLIDTKEDLEFLISKDIIVCGFNDKSVMVAMIKRLGSDYDVNGMGSEMFSLCHDLTDFQENPHNAWRAWIRRQICYRPCKTIGGFVMAVLLFVVYYLQSLEKNQM